MCPIEDPVDRCLNLLSFQANIAERWLERAQQNADPFASYFFSFSALNALYFAWAKADRLLGSRGSTPGDQKQMEHLV